MGCLHQQAPRPGSMGAFFQPMDPRPKHRRNQPNTTHLDRTPPSPLDALGVARELGNWDCHSVSHVLWLGKGAICTVGLWERDAGQSMFADAPWVTLSGPPTCPYHPTFLVVHPCQ